MKCFAARWLVVVSARFVMRCVAWGGCLHDMIVLLLLSLLFVEAIVLTTHARRMGRWIKRVPIQLGYTLSLLPVQ